MFEESELAELRERARRQIRARQRALRAAHSEHALAERSRRIVERVAELDAYREARSVALFWPLPREVDLRALDVRARSEGKLTFYPVMDSAENAAYTTGFARVESPDDLAPRGRRFAEPSASAPRARRGDIDLILVPALAVSAAGHRLGYGVGYYDATLPDFCPPARGAVVAYDFQLLAELPVLDHDVACAFVITDAQSLSVE